MNAITEEISIDVSGVKKVKSRRAIKELLKQIQFSFDELSDFWSRIDQAEVSLTRQILVFLDFHSLVRHINKTNQEFWAYRIRKDNFYFISMIRDTRDEKYADLIDDLTKLLDNRLSVIRINHDFETNKDKTELFREVQIVLSRNFSSDALKKVSYHKARQTFLAEFNDGTYGEVSLNELGIVEMRNELILDQPMISEQGNALILFTRDGETFDIDALVLKSLVSDQVKKEIRRQSKRTAEHVGDRIKMTRNETGVTQMDLSERTGIDQAIISKIETGKHIPRFDTLERIAKGLDLTVHGLLGDGA
ncbi:MAG: helix-turn-helix transcriptional regulator [Balneolaceae bacterium]